jgi:hypothetical protein
MNVICLETVMATEFSKNLLGMAAVAGGLYTLQVSETGSISIIRDLMMEMESFY